MHCIVLDDEPLAISVLKNYINRIPTLSAQGFYTDNRLAQERLLKGGIDLLFLDISMPDINGLDFFKSLEKPPMVIFTTAFSEFAVEGFNLNAVDYLLKPFDFNRFLIAVEKAAENTRFHKNSENQYQEFNAGSFFVPIKYSNVQVFFDQILFLEACNDYVKIYLKGQQDPLLTKKTLKAIQESLPNNLFIRIHRSFVVSVQKINSLRREKIYFNEGHTLPVGKTYLLALRETLKDIELRD